MKTATRLQDATTGPNTATCLKALMVDRPRLGGAVERHQGTR